MLCYPVCIWEDALQRTEYQANSGVGRCLISYNKRSGGALTRDAIVDPDPSHSAFGTLACGLLATRWLLQLQTT